MIPLRCSRTGTSPPECFGTLRSPLSLPYHSAYRDFGLGTVSRPPSFQVASITTNEILSSPGSLVVESPSVVINYSPVHTEFEVHGLQRRDRTGHFLRFPPEIKY